MVKICLEDAPVVFEAIYILDILGWIFVPVYIASGVSTVYAQVLHVSQNVVVLPFQSLCFVNLEVYR